MSLETLVLIIADSVRFIPDRECGQHALSQQANSFHDTSRTQLAGKLAFCGNIMPNNIKKKNATKYP